MSKKEIEKELKPTCDVCGSDEDLIFIDGSSIAFNICQICYEDILENEKKVKDFIG